MVDIILMFGYTGWAVVYLRPKNWSNMLVPTCTVLHGGVVGDNTGQPTD